MKVTIICSYKNGYLGELFFKEIDKENGRPYAIIKLEDGDIEVFYEGEYIEHEDNNN